MTDTPPHVYTDPAWAAREARRIALEEAAEIAVDHIAIAGVHEDFEGARYARRIANAIRALAEKQP